MSDEVYKYVDGVKIKLTTEELNVLKEEQAKLSASTNTFENSYITKRQREYPSIGDQLDAFWKGGAAAEEMKLKIQAVKDKYPKPE
jgi:hypothetical protein